MFDRIIRETRVLAEVTRLFILEKIYSYDLGKYEEVQSEIMKIVKSEFQLEILPSLTEKKPNKVVEAKELELSPCQKLAA